MVRSVFAKAFALTLVIFLLGVFVSNYFAEQRASFFLFELSKVGSSLNDAKTTLLYFETLKDTPDFCRNFPFFVAKFADRVDALGNDLTRLEEVDAGSLELAELKKKYNVVIENIPPLMAKTRPEWDLLEIKKNAPPVMDPAHYGPLRPELPDIYRQVLPNIVHIGYEHGFFFQHDLPNEKEFTALRHLLQIHSPRYLVLETYPWISVKKGKQVMEKLVREL